MSAPRGTGTGRGTRKDLKSNVAGSMHTRRPLLAESDQAFNDLVEQVEAQRN